MDILGLRSCAADAADFHSSLRKHYKRDVNTPFRYHFPAPCPIVSELYPTALWVDCGTTNSAIIVTKRQGPRGSTLLHEYCRLAPDDRPPT